MTGLSGGSPEKVKRLGIRRDDKYIYFLDKAGDVSRFCRLSSNPKNEKVARVSLKREKGFLYFVDSAGDISRSKEALDRFPEDVPEPLKSFMPKLKRLSAAIESGDSRRSKAATAALRRHMQDTKLAALLLPVALLWADHSWDESKWARYAIGVIKDKPVVRDCLLEHLRSPDNATRFRATAMLETFPQQAAIPILLKYAAEEKSEVVRARAVHALFILSLTDRKLREKVFTLCAKAAKARSPHIRRTAFECLSHFGGPRAGKILKHALRDPDRTIRTVEAPFWVHSHPENLSQVSSKSSRRTESRI